MQVGVVIVRVGCISPLVARRVRDDNDGGADVGDDGYDGDDDDDNDGDGDDRDMCNIIKG